MLVNWISLTFFLEYIVNSRAEKFAGFSLQNNDGKHYRPICPNPDHKSFNGWRGQSCHHIELFFHPQLSPRNNFARVPLRPGAYVPVRLPLNFPNQGSRENYTRLNSRLPFYAQHSYKLDSPFKRISNVSSTTSMSKKIPSTGVIEGTGPYFCGFRASSELNSLLLSVFVRDVGFFRCYFQGGALKLRSMTFGSGFYQCFFQRPGVKLSVRQGVGNYFCFFMGIRHFKGFIQAPPTLMREPVGFANIVASINYVKLNKDLSPIGNIQILGLYTYGPEGSDRNYGLLQATESYTLNLEKSITSVDKFDLFPYKVDQMPKTKTLTTSVDQSGLFQYHFKGTAIEEGRGDRFQSFAYNFVKNLERFMFTLSFIRYEIVGQGQGPEDDRDFVQIWGFCQHTFKPNPSSIFKNAFLQAYVVSQINFPGLRLNLGSDYHGLDFIQFILRYSESFTGFKESHLGTIAITSVFQTNSDGEEGTSLQIENQEASLESLDNLFIIIFQFLYNFASPEGVNGFVQFYWIYQVFLGETMARPPGYLQLLGVYAKTYKLFNDRSHALTWNIQGNGEYNLGDSEVSNGFFRIQGQIVVDTTNYWANELAGKELMPSTITFIGLYQCIWFGLRNAVVFCYIQIYAYYTGIITSPDGSGTAVLLWQYYQEVN